MIGETISHYRVLEKIGEGGMGQVYLAHDGKLDRKVALKFLAVDDDLGARRRFLREARSAAGLDHPYICKIYDVGEDRGRVFIVMERVEGRSLQEELADGPLAIDDVLRLGGEIAEALERAHRSGIVHRDLKPANIMRGTDGHVKILDFGLAKRVDDSGSDRSTEADATQTELTKDGTVLGTLAYMSPEQARGQPVDSRSDLFSLGIVLYQMLTGVQPFQRASAADTAKAVLGDEPAPLARFANDVPELLQHIVRKLLTKSPEERYQLAQEVRTDLARVVARGTVGGGVPATRRRIGGRTLAGIGLLVATAAIAWWVRGTFFPSVQAALAFQARDWILIADVENFTGDELFDHSLDAALTVAIEQSQYVNVFPRARVAETLDRMQRQDVERLDETLAREVALREGVKAVLVCSISRVGEAYSIGVRLLEPEQGAAVLSRSSTAASPDEVLVKLDDLATAIREQLGESLSGITARSLPLHYATTSSLEALRLFSKAKHEPRTDLSEQSWDRIRKAVELDPGFALAHAELGFHYYSTGREPQGEMHFQKALSLLDRLTIREQLWIRALAEDWRGEREQAIESYRTYLAQYPDDSSAWFRLGYANLVAVRCEASIEAFERALEIDPKMTTARINIATCLPALGRLEEAAATYESAFAMDPETKKLRFVNHEYGFLLVRLGRMDEAIDTFELAIREGFREKGLRSLGLLRLYQGKYSDGIDLVEEAAALNRNNGATVSELVDRMILAEAYAMNDMRAESDAQLARLLAIEEQTRLAAAWLESIGRLLARRGRVDEAKEILAEIDRRIDDPTTAGAVNRSRARDESLRHQLAGEIALASGRLDRALESLRLARNLDRGVFGLALARALQADGQPNEAIPILEEIRGRAGALGKPIQFDWFRAHRELAELYEETGEPARAIEIYEMLLGFWSDGDPDLVARAEVESALVALQAHAEASAE